MRSPSLSFFLLLPIFIAPLCACDAGRQHRINEFMRFDDNRPGIYSENNFGLTPRSDYINPHTYRTPGADLPLYQTATKLHDPTDTRAANEARQARNQLQHILIRLSNKVTAEHLSRIAGNQASVNVGLGGATLVLTGLAAVSTGGSAQTLAAAATGTTGFRALIGEQVYRNALVETLINAIITEREQMRIAILSNQQKPILEYNADRAIEDVDRLHRVGSFYNGLQLIRQAAEDANRKRLSAIELIQKEQRDSTLLKLRAENKKFAEQNGLDPITPTPSTQPN